MPRVVQTGFIWICPNRNVRAINCGKEKSVLTDSMFNRCNVELRKIIVIMYEWSWRTQICVTAAKLDITEQTASRYYSDFRNICSWKLVQQLLVLGGPGHVVEIDESMFSRAKYDVGHALHVPRQWIFGIYDPQTKQGILRTVDQREAATLLPIIQQVVLPGTMIYSDEWVHIILSYSCPNHNPSCILQRITNTTMSIHKQDVRPTTSRATGLVPKKLLKRKMV